MTENQPSHPAELDWLTAVAIAAIAISLNVAFHEGVHAATCLLVGGDLLEFSALHVDCRATADWQSRVVAGSASIANLLLGTLIWRLLSRLRNRVDTSRLFFLWLFMLMNWLYGAGYWMLSGAANLGDWAVVIAGWEPHLLWRGLLFVAGALLFVYFVWLALHELGQFLGGSAPEQLSRAAKLGILTYITSALVILAAGWFNPYGILGLPSVAGAAAVLGALSPLLWMMQWLKARSFPKPAGPPLTIPRSWSLVGLGGLAVILYAVVLGRTLYF